MAMEHGGSFTSADAKAIIDRHLDEPTIRENVIRIARTPCPQTELYEREPMILRAIRTLYRPTFEEYGCDTWIDDYGNLIASQGEGRSDAKTILFMGYAMAWAEGTMPNPWSGEIMDGARFGVEGEVVWGRGGAEYHPTNAAMLEAARIVHISGVKIPGRIIYVVSSGGHTSSSDPIYHLVYNDRVKADLCIHPGTREIILGNKGRLDLRVNVHGKSVHSGGEIEVGLNAIEGGVKVLERLQSIMPFPPGGTDDPDMGRGRLSVIGLGSYPFSPGYHNGVGSGGHTLQNLMRIMLDRRLSPGQDIDQAIDEIKSAVGDMSPWRVTFEPGALHYPSKHAPDAPIITSVADAFRTALGEEPTYRYVDYTVDCGYLNMAGIPTVMWGAINMADCHADIEFTNLAQTYDVARVFGVWAMTNAR
jgi:acetylornithine deacetylase/succinyl-diaminopimelate desuccinylase-like protein